MHLLYGLNKFILDQECKEGVFLSTDPKDFYIEDAWVDKFEQ
jgi:hypothetical protein